MILNENILNNAIGRMIVKSSDEPNYDFVNMMGFDEFKNWINGNYLYYRTGFAMNPATENMGNRIFVHLSSIIQINYNMDEHSLAFIYESRDPSDFIQALKTFDLFKNDYKLDSPFPNMGNTKWCIVIYPRHTQISNSSVVELMEMFIHGKNMTAYKQEPIQYAKK